MGEAQPATGLVCPDPPDRTDAHARAIEARPEFVIELTVLLLIASVISYLIALVRGPIGLDAVLPGTDAITGFVWVAAIAVAIWRFVRRRSPE